MTIKSGHGLVIGFILAALAVVMYVIAPHDVHSKPVASGGDCVVLVWNDAVAQYGSDHAGTVWDDYMAHGWHGDPRDHMEALWSPECTSAYVGNLIGEYHL